MDKYIFVALGILDAIAIISLIVLSFRWPFWENFKRILVIGVIISLISYVNRMILDIPQFDPPIQLLVYTLCIRYILRVNTFYAWPLTVYGYVCFLLVQFVTYTALMSSGIVTAEDAASATGWGTYLIQITSDLACLAIAATLYIFNIGYTYVDIPPHDDYVSIRRTKWDMAVNIAGSLVIMTYLCWIIYHGAPIYIILPSLLIVKIAMLYLCRRKEID